MFISSFPNSVTIGDNVVPGLVTTDNGTNVAIYGITLKSPVANIHQWGITKPYNMEHIRKEAWKTRKEW